VVTVRLDDEERAYSTAVHHHRQFHAGCRRFRPAPPGRGCHLPRLIQQNQRQAALPHTPSRTHFAQQGFYSIPTAVLLIIPGQFRL